MFEFIREHQLNTMLFLCGSCGIMVLLLSITRFLSKSRRLVLIIMESIAFLLLWFDRLAYIYAGDISRNGYVMVRLANFMVFFLTSAIVLGFNNYLADWLLHEGGRQALPKRLILVAILALIGMILAVVSAFTGLYYYFDDMNVYHRGVGFLIAYVVPVICPVIQLTIIMENRKALGKLIFTSMLLYLVVPLVCGILQIFTYGISIVNMSMVAVSLTLYIFAYLDINNTVENAHKVEIRSMEKEKKHMKNLFDQTATAFVSAVEKKDDFTKGTSVRVAEYAKKVAKLVGKDEEECDRIYYAALLHDVGLIGIPDRVIKNEADPDKWDYEVMRKKPVIGKEILSSITEFPFLSEGAYYSHERYDGSGYPEGLSGEDIPETARIVGVADAFVTMTSRKRYRDARPKFLAREAFIKGAGATFDPVFAKAMVKIIDTDSNDITDDDTGEIETEISCTEYRNKVLKGIRVENEVKRITFYCDTSSRPEDGFSMPGIILFDSYDAKVHADAAGIGEYHYLEYGELWFDDNMITTAARKMVVTRSAKRERIKDGDNLSKDEYYEMVVSRYEDHLKLEMTGPTLTKEVIVALTDKTKSAYVGITGENCRLYDINVEKTGRVTKSGDIKRLAKELNYTDHIESDIKNIQIDTPRSASTEGVEIENRLRIRFHAQSLPGASLVWHCPYVVLFASDDGLVTGKNYREYALIKLNGEDNGDSDISKNSFSMKKTENFPGWDEWKQRNAEGVECELTFEKKGNKISFRTETLGIKIENVTTITDDTRKIYVALTGDECALTDIRVR